MADTSLTELKDMIAALLRKADNSDKQTSSLMEHMKMLRTQSRAPIQHMGPYTSGATHARSGRRLDFSTPLDASMNPKKEPFRPFLCSEPFFTLFANIYFFHSKLRFMSFVYEMIKAI